MENSLQSYRGRKPSGAVAVSLPANNTISEPAAPPPSRPSPQPTVHMIKTEQTTQQQPMTAMPFYTDPNRFSSPVWQATDPTQGWSQGQFIQQIPAGAQPVLDGYPQQYSNGVYQATFQQPAGFESNTFYTGAIQVLTRPPSASNQTQLSSRSNGSYSHTPSPVSAQQSQQSNQRTNISTQYQQEYSNTNQNYVAPSTTPTGNVDSSRPSSVNSSGNVSTNNQNFQGNFTPISSSNFSPVTNAGSNFVNSNNASTNSGNAMPGYSPVSNHPQVASHNYSGGYPGSDLSGQPESPQSESSQHWSASAWEQNVVQACNDVKIKTEPISEWEQSVVQQCNADNVKIKMEPLDELQYGLETHNQSQTEPQFSQADRVNLNSRIKTMILTKQQQQLENKVDEKQNTAGHFLSYSHHRRPYILDDGGGIQHSNRIHHTQKYPNGIKEHVTPHSNGFNNFEKAENDIKLLDNQNYSKFKSHTSRLLNQQYNLKKFDKKDKIGYINDSESKAKVPPDNTKKFGNTSNKYMPNNTTSGVGVEIPPCDCLPTHEFMAEPGSYYTHLGCSSSLVNLRQDLEERTGVNGNALRIEKICYTGKEGKTPQGCPIAKWIIRRGSYDEKYLILVKRRIGHFCRGAIIVVCIVAWEGVIQNDADTIYNMLVNKLNKFGLPTNRRCATNEQRTCACQGLDPDRCGASFSFGCSWSMYYNGCKYARSKFVRKFRLNIKTEEEEVEERLQSLATNLSPLYKVLAPQSFKNQCQYEHVASDCRLGTKPGRPFSGVTACVDFCAHAHKDIHNMNNGCTVVVTLTKYRGLSKPKDEQLHVLPLYVIDRTDEFGSQKNQESKIVQGSIEVLYRYPFEVRIRNTPQPTCRRKKRKDETQEKQKRSNSKKESSPSRAGTPQRKTPTHQLQSDLVSSTVVDHSSWSSYDDLYYNPDLNHSNNYFYNKSSVFKQGNRDNALNLTYPSPPYSNYSSNQSVSPSPSTPNIKYQQNTAMLDHDYVGSYGRFSSPVTPPRTPNNLPSFKHIRNFKGEMQDPTSILVQNPFDDSFYFNQHEYYNYYDYENYNSSPLNWLSPNTTPPNWFHTSYTSKAEPPSAKVLGQITETIDNSECFNDPEVGGVAIALSHGSVLFECAKHELHATTALQNPNRLSPTRISLVFYQHRNLNRSKHGWDEHEEKMRLRKLDLSGADKDLDLPVIVSANDVVVRAPTMTTVSVTTVFPMYPCSITGPYQIIGRGT